MKCNISRCFSPLVLTLLSFLCFFSATASAQLTGSGSVSDFTYSGSRSRQYKVYVPTSYDTNTPAPMIMALHGCAMDHSDALDLWNLDLVADEHGVILVFPFVTSFTEMRNENCWGYWFDQHVQEGRNGEVDDLYGLAQEVENRYNINAERRYITGISSGGAMAIAEAIAYNNYWAAAAPVAGLPYGDWSSSVLSEMWQSLQTHINEINNELNYDRAVPMLVVQSSQDTTVQPRAMELIRDSQLSVWGGDLSADGSVGCDAQGVNCVLTTYNGPSGNALVKTLYYDGVFNKQATYGSGHYWPGGDVNADLWSNVGPSASQHMWAFFEEVAGNPTTLPGDDGSGGGSGGGNCNGGSSGGASGGVSDTVVNHYVAGRLGLNEYLSLGGSIGYNTSITLYPSGSSWTQTPPSGGSSGGSGDCDDSGGGSGGGNGGNNGGNTGTPGTWSSQSIAGMSVNLYSPNSTTSNGQRALMISLHGCSQSANDVRNGWGWEDEADSYGMVIAAPGAPNGGVILGCWDYYGSNHSGSNPGRHDDNLVDLANNLMANTSLNIDPDQVYISGLSSGGGETFVMGCIAPQIFAGMGINAGPAIGTSSGQIGSVPFGTTASSVANLCRTFSANDSAFDTQVTSVVHGNSDFTVAQGYADVDAEAMANVYGASRDNGSSSVSGGGTETTWSDNGGVRVSKVMVNGLGHAWPAGSGSGGGTYTNHSTIDYPAYLTRFLFDNNRRADFTQDDTTAPAIPNSLAVTNTTEDSISIGWNAVGDQDLDFYSVYVDGSLYTTTTSTNATISGLDADTSYSFAVSATDTSGNASAQSSSINGETEADTGGGTPTPTPVPATPTPTPTPTPDPTPVATPVPSCDDSTTYNYYHKTAGRAYSTGSYWTPNYYANGSNNAMQGSTWGYNTLHSFNGSTWYLGACP